MPAAEARDRRDAAAIGRRARLELVFERRRGRTILAHGYAEPPFRVGATLPDDGYGIRLILAWSAPGIFGGDRLEQHVRVEAGARVRLTSQSALQAHPSPVRQLASLTMAVEVEEGAALHGEWDPLIPFPGARLSQRTAIRLAPGASLYWSEAFMSGREGRGERWQFERLEQELAVRRAQTLEYLERYRLEPASENLPAAWVASDACYFGTVVASGPACAAPGELARELAARDRLVAAVDDIDPQVTLVRLMGGNGPAFHAARERVRACLAGPRRHEPRVEADQRAAADW